MGYFQNDSWTTMLLSVRVKHPTGVITKVGWDWLPFK